jgi:hypothetical protein
VQQQRSPTTDTDADGRFEMTPLAEDWRMVVLHETGTAELSREEYPKDGVIQLQPWARIEGTLRIGSKPAPAGTEVQYHPLKMPVPDTAYISHIAGAKTDDEGRFVFDRLPAGQGRVARQIKMKGPGDYALYAGSGHRDVDLKSGETARVELGGTGRPIVGRVVREGGIPDNWFGTASVFGKSQHYCANLEADGRFRIDDVEPGTYSLEIDFREVPGEHTHIGPSAAYISHSFAVAEVPGGRSDEPLDLGELQVKPRPQR